jgi:HlyD family secretion protein/epimerase transport system membrane fusion protein
MVKWLTQSNRDGNGGGDGSEKNRRSLRRPIVAGALLIAITFGGFGTWAAVAPLATGAVAQGRVAVEAGRQVVDHHEGGIVKEILVEAGDNVDEGEVLVRLSDVQARATYQRLRSQLLTTLATEARLEAEKQGGDQINFPVALQDFGEGSEIAGVKDDQRALFQARREELQGQLEILESRISQLRTRIEGLQEQQTATHDEKRLIAEELEGQRRLYDKGLATKTRVLALERRAATIRGQLGNLKANIAESQNSIGETELQRIQIRKNRRREVADQLTNVRAQVASLRERLSAAEDRLERTRIRAPRSGQIVDPQVRTVGASIRPGQALMYVVPVRDRLVLEARLRPGDIDSVDQGMPAEVRITGLPQRSTPLLRGVVKTVAADSIQDDQTGKEYYPITVTVPQDELAKLDRELIPGMPATVMINAGQKTLVQYLVEPWTRAIERAFRES